MSKRQYSDEKKTSRLYEDEGGPLRCNRCQQEYQEGEGWKATPPVRTPWGEVARLCWCRSCLEALGVETTSGTS